MNAVTEPSFICRTCLRDYSNNLHLGLKWCDNTLKAHQSKCKLPYSTNVFAEGKLEVFCIAPNASKREKKFVYNTVGLTMMNAGEIKADKLGWNPATKRRECERFQPHLFVPVLAGLTAGLVLVNRRKCCTVFIEDNVVRDIASDELFRWTVCRLWVCDSSRRQRIATKAIRAIAEYFEIDTSEVGWMLPFTDDGRNFIGSLTNKQIHVTK